jgi:prefoldin beta subunit
MQKAQLEKQKYSQSKNKVSTQISENILVKNELDKLKDEETVYKLIASALVSIECSEAKMQVSKRLNLFEKELFFFFFF